MRILCTLVLGAVCLAGCKSLTSRDSASGTGPGRAQRGSPRAAQQKMPQVTPVFDSVGQVAAVRPVQRFVVIDFYLSRLPEIGQRMAVYRQGLKVGEVRISGPEHNRNIVADLMAGEAQVGDEVRAE